MDDNLESPGKSLFNSPKLKVPLGERSVLDFNIDCAGSIIEDFGRESLGIIDFNHPDFRRDSLSLLYDPRKEDSRRESLGIIHLNNEWKSKYQLGLPEVTFTEFDGFATDSLLNTAFVASVLPSGDTDFDGFATDSLLNAAFVASVLPSDDTDLSVNSNCLEFEREGPSKIFSTCSSRSSVFNQAFESSAGFFRQLLSERYNNLFKTPQRVQSLPSELETVTEINKKSNDVEELDEKRKIRSDTFVIGINEGETFTEEDDKFNDSVFLEANHLAHKVANTSDLNDGDMVDCILEPADLMTEISLDEESAMCGTETVFKTVDKMLPPVILFQNITPQHNNLNQNATEPFKKDEGNIFNNSNKSNNSNRDPQEIINSLSELLNKVSPTEQQKTVGQNLLSSLAEIINGNSVTSHLDDSGHSSSESEFISSQNECYEVLDLRKKTSFESTVSQSESYEICAPLDLSLKSKSANSEKGWSPKILPGKITSQHKLIKTRSAGSNCSVSTNEDKILIDSKIKFKPRKMEEKVSKGPLKAVIPVSNMTRKKSIQVTPTRSEVPISKHSQKKNNTPINKFNMKPMAQSTPEGCSNAISPLSTPNSSPRTTKQKLNYSGPSVPNRSQNLPKSFIRRHSVSDMKQKEATERSLKRSNSVGENSGLKTTAQEAKQKITKATKHTSIPNKSVLQENRNKSTVKLPGSKKFGKENVR